MDRIAAIAARHAEEVRQAFEAGYRARPASREQWIQHELTGEPRQFDFSPGGSAEDILSEAWTAYRAYRASRRGVA